MATSQEAHHQPVTSANSGEKETFEAPINPPAASKERATSSDNSEYDSVDSYSDNDEEKEPGKARSKGSENEESVILEREEGDGQESVPQRKVDDDEDKKNPQYIPKRGTFYEHDDRTAEEEAEKDQPTEEAEAAEKDKDGKKKVWQDKKERWGHDKFIDQEQGPKSRSELIAIYGYDIRNEEGPPRARRRRRYGRGPNKYTRNWEDEDAYTKSQAQPVKPQKKRNQDEFPPLMNSRKTEAVDNEPKQNDNNYSQNPGQVVDNQDPPGRSHQMRAGTGRVIKPKREIKDSDYKGFTSKSRQQRGVRNEPPPRGGPRRDSNDYVQTQNFTNTNQINDVEREMGQLNIQDNNYNGRNRQGSVPPRLQNNEPKGPKRYSSMRQRSLPETANPPPGNFSFYPNDYNSIAPPPATQQPILPPSALVSPQQVPVTGTPPAAILQAQFVPPPTFPTQPAQYLPTAPPPPAAFIGAAPPQPPIYVPQAQPSYAVAGFQGPFNPVVTQSPTELYQPQGGITYYPADQQIQTQRAPPPKRRTAAIAIVAPKEHEETD